jgi:uncharacterized protein (DUF2062 family)
MSDLAAILIGSLICAAILAGIFLTVRVVWLLRVWAEDRRREQEYADAWLRAHRQERLR